MNFTTEELQAAYLKPNAPHYIISTTLTGYFNLAASEVNELVDSAIKKFRTWRPYDFEVAFPGGAVEGDTYRDMMYLTEDAPLELVAYIMQKAKAKMPSELRDNAVNLLLEEYDKVEYPLIEDDQYYSAINLIAGAPYTVINAIAKLVRAEDSTYSEEAKRAVDFLTDKDNKDNYDKSLGVYGIHHAIDHKINPYHSLLLLPSASSEEIRIAVRFISGKYSKATEHPLDHIYFNRVNKAAEILKDVDERAKLDSRLKVSKGGEVELANSTLFSLKKSQERKATRNPLARDGVDVHVEVETDLFKSTSPQRVPISYRVKAFCAPCLASGKVIPDDVPRCPKCDGTKRIKHQVTGEFNALATQELNCGFCKDWPDPHVPCDSCSGKGYTRETKTRIVSLPTGVTDGKEFFEEGEGNPGFLGGKDGNLFIKVNLKMPKGVTSEGANIKYRLPLKYSELCAGTTVTIAPLGEEFQLDIPELTSPGTEIVCEGKGCLDLIPLVMVT